MHNDEYEPAEYEGGSPKPLVNVDERPDTSEPREEW